PEPVRRVSLAPRRTRNDALTLRSRRSRYRVPSGPEMGMNKAMNTMQRSARSAAPTVSIRRLPASGNTALAASALIQAALGIEFFLSGLNKFADPNFVR